MQTTFLAVLIRLASVVQSASGNIIRCVRCRKTVHRSGGRLRHRLIRSVASGAFLAGLLGISLPSSAKTVQVSFTATIQESPFATPGYTVGDKVNGWITYTEDYPSAMHFAFGGDEHQSYLAYLELDDDITAAQIAAQLPPQYFQAEPLNHYTSPNPVDLYDVRAGFHYGEPFVEGFSVYFAELLLVDFEHEYYGTQLPYPTDFPSLTSFESQVLAVEFVQNYYPGWLMIQAPIDSVTISVLDPAPGLVHQIPAAEYAGLLDLYNSTHGSHWRHQEGWLDPAAPSWYGVTVSGSTYDPATGQVLTVGHVTKLELSDNELWGNLPDSLGNLLYLEVFNLGQNHVAQSFPAWIGNLQHLKELSLWGNGFGGPLLSSIGNLKELVRIDLSSNQLSETIPDAVGDLVALTELRLNDNQFVGGIPDVLGRLSKLEVLDLSGNQLAGPIPSSLANLENVAIFDLGRNKLTGSIPEFLGSMRRLKGLGLSYNSLTGGIPESFGNLSQLESLALDGLNLDGSIPELLTGLTGLKSLSLGDNQFTGTIPDFLSTLVNLESLFLAGNRLTGTIPESLGNLSKLAALGLERNQLTGSIPESLGRLEHLGYVVLWDNQLSGDIPESFLNAGPLPKGQLWLAQNCFDISPGSRFRTQLQQLDATWAIDYKPQKLGCGPVALGDLNNDGCVDREDLSNLLLAIRARSHDLSYDVNGDGKVDIADARFLAMHFTNPDGSSCPL